MPSEQDKIGWRFWGRWVLVTTIGWTVGNILAFIVAHLVAPIVSIAIPHETNLVVGVCLGAVVGYAQRRYAPNRITASGRWILSTAIGMGIPFVVVTIAHEIWSGIPLGVVLILAVGGLFTGLLQLRNVRRHSGGSGWWLLASIAGWGLGWVTMNLGFAVGLLLGGAVLGAVTGGAMVWLLQSPPATDPDAREPLPTADTASLT